MYNITMFTTEEELMELTGITDPSQLWEVGFDLDDWDVGFCCDKSLDHACKDNAYDIPMPYGISASEYDSNHRVANDDADWLVNRMADYCIGYYHVEYNGKHYYTVHHA